MAQVRILAAERLVSGGVNDRSTSPGSSLFADAQLLEEPLPRARQVPVFTVGKGPAGLPFDFERARSRTVGS